MTQPANWRCGWTGVFDYGDVNFIAKPAAIREQLATVKSGSRIAGQGP
jgi:hypothetical protein